MDTDLRTAAADLIQMTWVRGGRMYSREWVDSPESRVLVRATRIGLMGLGAARVSTERIPRGDSYTEYGE